MLWHKMQWINFEVWWLKNCKIVNVYRMWEAIMTYCDFKSKTGTQLSGILVTWTINIQCVLRFYLLLSGTNQKIKWVYCCVKIKDIPSVKSYRCSIFCDWIQKPLIKKFAWEKDFWAIELMPFARISY